MEVSVRAALIACLIVGGLRAEPLPIDVSAEAAIVMNADTHAILYEKNAKEILYPASLTKIATALYTVEESGANLDNMAWADQDAVGFVTESAKRRSNYSMPPYYLEFGANQIGIHPGEHLKLRDLLYAMMVSSANDAANVIAQHVGGSIPLFMKELNQYFQKLGMQATQFSNPHGLHHPDHVTTAYDLAILTSAALKNPLFCDMCATTHYRRPETDKHPASTLVQTNRLLRRGKYYYPKAIGVKTGYTSLAKNCVAAAARHKGRTLVVILLKAPERAEMFRDAIRLFEAAFNQPMLEQTVLSAGPQQMHAKIQKTFQKVQATVPEPVLLRFYPAEEQALFAKVEWDELSLPIEAGQKIGALYLQNEQGHTLAKTSLTATRSVSPSVLEQLLLGVKSLGPAGWLGMVCLLALPLWLLLNVSPRRSR